MLEAFGISDPGRVRSNNEDYFISDTRSGIFILADGMGGANAGEYASRLSAETLYQYLLNTPATEDITTLAQGFAEANAAVRDASQNSPDLDGMGTTLIAARTVDGNRLQVGSVGDSRAYLLSQGELSLLTNDQTWVAEVGARLGLSQEALRKHPMRHVLTMAIGATSDLRVNSQTITLGSGDQLLLCSDGLHGVIDEKNLLDILVSEKSLPDKCHYLIEAAKELGGPDNITVILLLML